ncbi:MAG: hypothetical protein D6714_07710, partial [Bacteroidetes bacterium]
MKPFINCRRLAFLVLFGLVFIQCKKSVPPPEPFGPTPSARQLDWHKMKYYAFVHFNMNTFTGKEWGTGTEDPDTFFPTRLDCRQWVKTAKAAGMEGIILTAKHHDGFCLWPSKYSDHTVAQSAWRNGKGDVLKDLSEACREFGLKMGLYLSPWDKHSPLYGTPEYNELFKNQLREVLTNYGEIFEVWFDGAVGEGYEGKQLYDWDGFIQVVRELQPNAVIFSDAGPDIRWVGTEAGFANPTNWCTLNRDNYYPGTPDFMDLRSGNKNGTHWVPAEVNTSIRPGWYFHPEQDTEVKSVEHLELIYYHSVGRNGNLLLNLPVDRRGLVPETDSTRLMELKKRLDATFTRNFASNATVSASNIRGGDAAFSPENLTDGDAETYWATDDDTQTAELILTWDTPQTFNLVALHEYLPLGQRIERVSVAARSGENWEPLAEVTTVGRTRFVRIPKTTTNQLKISILSSMAPPVLAEISVWLRPHDNYLLESEKEKNARMAWWRAAGFGMFIHWGAYAVPGGIYRGKEVSGVGEWIMNHGQIPIPAYEQFVRRFNPQKFDAREWARIAKAAGMKYMVITSKHHDGFCLWDSAVSDYDIMDFAPFKRDILGELAEACRAEGIRLGFYYSIMDWHHPDAQGINYPKYNDDDSFNPRFPHYRDEYMKPQLKELIEKYDPAILWFDGEWIKNWTEAQGKDLYQYVRSLKPDILINNRVGKGRQGRQGMNKAGEFVGDFGTPEQEILEHLRRLMENTDYRRRQGQEGRR